VWPGCGQNLRSRFRDDGRHGCSVRRHIPLAEIVAGLIAILGVTAAPAVATRDPSVAKALFLIQKMYLSPNWMIRPSSAPVICPKVGDPI
jgi:hypothetical protein